MGFVSMNNLTKNGSKENSKIELMTICSTYSENQERLKRMAVLLFKKRKNYVQDILFIAERLNVIDNLPDWCSSDINDSRVGKYLCNDRRCVWEKRNSYR